MTEIQIEPNSFEMVFFDAEKIVNLDGTTGTVI